jgi:hypothetical protein
MSSSGQESRYRATSEPAGRRRRALRPLLVLLGALVAAAAVPAAASAHVGNNQVSGDQSPPVTDANRCFEKSAAASYTMTGSLVGCWYTDTFIVTKDTKRNGIEEIHAIGTEHFVGCLDVDRGRHCTRPDPHGTLAFTFTFIGQFNATTGKEIQGSCHHPIVSGTDDFAGATGVLNFTDTIVNETLVSSPYTGHIKLLGR